MKNSNPDNLSLVGEMAAKNAVTPGTDDAPAAYGKIPQWTWLFVAACWFGVFLSPGILPFVLAAFSSFACTNMARDETQTMSARLRNTAAVVLICWLLFTALYALALRWSKSVTPMPQRGAAPSSQIEKR